MKLAASAMFFLSASLAFLAHAGGALNILLAGSIAVLGSSTSPTSLTLSIPSTTLTSAATTCTAKGGVPPYTYGWSWGSGGTSIAISSPSSSTTAFTVSGAALNTTYSGTAQCLVTDRRPLTAPLSNVSVSLSRIPLLPPSIGSATLVAGTSGAFVGYDSGAEGSLSTTIDYNGLTTQHLACNMIAGTLQITIAQPSANPNYITAMVVNGTTYLESSATYAFAGGALGTWTWTVACPFTSGSSYPVLYY